MRVYTWQDRLIQRVDHACKALTPNQTALRPNPAKHMPPAVLTPAERYHAAGLMRINHVGEVCAQALYQGQSIVARTPQLREMLLQSAQEEADHLAWCRESLEALENRTSYLNPLWYFFSLVIGICVGLAGDGYSLGFLAETESQVVRHLEDHLALLPEKDLSSRCIVEKMRLDEMHHQTTAQQMGAKALPKLVKCLMQGAAKLMKWTAYYV